MVRRRCDPIVALVLAAGCNSVLGLHETQPVDAGTAGDAMITFDRDRDGIGDHEDPCIAGISDRVGDFEGDAIANAEDGCPFDYDSADADVDGVWDECDPFPQLAGDTIRCFMAFANPSINFELWQPRAGDEDAWIQYLPNGMAARAAGTLIATERIDGPATTSFDLYASMTTGQPGEVAVQLWLRAGATPSPADLGCELRTDALGSRLIIRGTTPTVETALPTRLVSFIRLRATLQLTAPPNLPNVRCSVLAVTGAVSASATARVAVPDGTAGLATENTTGTFSALTIFHRDDPQPL